MGKFVWKCLRPPPLLVEKKVFAPLFFLKKSPFFSKKVFAPLFFSKKFSFAHKQQGKMSQRKEGQDEEKYWQMFISWQWKLIERTQPYTKIMRWIQVKTWHTRRRQTIGRLFTSFKKYINICQYRFPLKKSKSSQIKHGLCWSAQPLVSCPCWFQLIYLFVFIGNSSFRLSEFWKTSLKLVWQLLSFIVDFTRWFPWPKTQPKPRFLSMHRPGGWIVECFVEG